MCAIFGELMLAAGEVKLEALPSMLRALAHRGPDGAGCYVAPGHQLMLGHARLSLVDFAGGGQPLLNEAGSIVAVVNGEFYEHARLRRELEARGHHFSTRCDSEVLLHLYAEYGIECLDQLIGEFAAALYDARSATLYLIRDRFGIKPLFVASDARSLVFASEVKGILAHSGAGRELDRNAIGELTCGIMRPWRTAFSGIKSVRPGHFLSITQGRISEHRYFQVALPPATLDRRELTPKLEGELVDEFYERFQKAVELRLQADFPVGVYLSGGIDSSSVAAMAAKSRGGSSAFTIGFSNAEFDETRSARDVARRFGLEHHVLTLKQSDLESVFPRSVWHSEMPTANAHGAAKMCLSALAGRHVKAVLTGEGADEVFAGYSYFWHQHLLERARLRPNDACAKAELREFYRQTRLLSGACRTMAYADYDRVVARLGAYPYGALRAIDYRRSFQHLFAKDVRARLETADVLEPFEQELHTRLDTLSSLSASQYYAITFDLPGYMLSVLGDRPEMANSLEGRVPFLDHRVVELVARLPHAMRVRGGHGKYVVRRALAGELPELGSKPKRNFLAPSTDSLSLDRRDGPIAEYLSADTARRVGIFSPGRVSALRVLHRALPRKSQYFSLCEASLLFVASTHALHAFASASPEAALSSYGFAHQHLREVEAFARDARARRPLALLRRWSSAERRRPEAAFNTLKELHVS